MTPPLPHMLLRASAGTGKTYQLVEAYARLVQEDGLRPGQIVAITYTRRAAVELRHRIRARLEGAGAAPSILAELAQAPLGNFHGLALQWLRAHASAVPGGEGLSVMAQAEGDLFVQACLHSWFAGDAVTGAAAQQLALYLPVADGLAEAVWRATSLAREDAVGIGGAYVHRPRAQAACRAAHARLLVLRASLLAGGGALKKAAQERLRRFAAQPLPSLAKIDALSDRAAPAQALAAYTAWGAAWRHAFDGLGRQGSLRELYTEADAAWVRAVVPEVEADGLVAALAPAVACLVEAGWQAYGRLKHASGGVDFADLIERFCQLVMAEPQVHMALRQRIAAVLVDEAQDTNRLQRHMVDLLCGFAGPAADMVPAARVFVVGDWKQSIYTFRGADPQSFAALAHTLDGRGADHATLAMSRRASAPLVAAINSLGSALFGPRYEPLQPPIGPPIAASGPAASSMMWLQLPEGQSASAAQALQHEAGATALWVQTRLGAGVHAGDIAILLTTMAAAPTFARALQRLDVPAIIGGGSGLYAQPEVTDHLALLGWLASPGAELLASVSLRSPLFGLSDAALWEIFGPAGRACRALASLVAGVWPPPAAQPHPTPQAPPSDETRALTHSALHISHLMAQARGRAVAALLHDIDARLQARAVYLAMEGGRQRVANVQRLWAMAAAHDRAHGPALHRFVATQERRLRNQAREPLPPVPAATRLAVSITTVHQAKGLQYPIVILPALSPRPPPLQDDFVYARGVGFTFRPRHGGVARAGAAWRRAEARRQSDEAEEKKRLLYVAVTRAQAQVTFVGPPPVELAPYAFGRLLAPWVANQPPELTILPAPTGAAPIGDEEPSRGVDDGAAAAQIAPAPRVLQLPVMPEPPAPPTRRPPPGTHFSLTVTDLAAHCAGRRAGAGLATLGPSGPGHAVAGDATAALDAATLGEMAHGVLAALGQRVTYASDTAFLADCLGHYGYAADDIRLAELDEDLQAFLRTPLAQMLIGLPAVARRHEMPFALHNHHRGATSTLHGQLDLAFCADGQATLVDFKYARQHEANPAIYLYQLDTYAWALSRLTRLSAPIPCLLVFLRGGGPPMRHVSTEARQAHVCAQLDDAVAALASGVVPTPGAR